MDKIIKIDDKPVYPSTDLAPLGKTIGRFYRDLINEGTPEPLAEALTRNLYLRLTHAAGLAEAPGAPDR